MSELVHPWRGCAKGLSSKWLQHIGQVQTKPDDISCKKQKEKHHYNVIFISSSAPVVPWLKFDVSPMFLNHIIRYKCDLLPMQSKKVRSALAEKK